MTLQTELTAARIDAMRDAIAALVMTHPDPAAFAAALETLRGQRRAAGSEAQRLGDAIARELIDVAHMEMDDRSRR